MGSERTDYRPGQPRVPVGTRVRYRGADWKVEAQLPVGDVPGAEVNYPDGVAYVLWPLDVVRRFGSQRECMARVRRTSFRVERCEER